MKRDIVNRPLKSNWIGGLYVSAIILIVSICLVVYLFAGLNEADLVAKAVFNLVMLLVLLVILITIIGFYTTKYRIKDGLLYSWSPFTVIKISLKDIKKVEKTLVPIHFKVGASLYSGLFYVPSLGWVSSIITNLSDAILITTKKGKYYMITPSNPERFMKLLK